MAHAAMIFFHRFAKSKGYAEKVYGDDAYTRKRSPQSPMIKLIGARNGKLQIFETGIGRYEVQYRKDETS